jgi:putative transposase
MEEARLCGLSALSLQNSAICAVLFVCKISREATARWGAPEIVNTDQGSQFSSTEFIAEVQRIGAHQSMDGRGCWRDNVFVERLWRSMKYEDVYLKGYDGVSATRCHLAAYFDFYNARRPHQLHDRRTPDMVYFATLPAMRLPDGLNQEYMPQPGRLRRPGRARRLKESNSQPIHLSQVKARSDERSRLY